MKNIIKFLGPLKSDSPHSERDFGADQFLFDQQSAKTKKLELLKAELEKASGHEINVLNKTIKNMAEEGNAPTH